MQFFRERGCDVSDLNRFKDWVLEKPRRSVKIELGGLDGPERVSIWVYDYERRVGQHVSDVSEIDLDRQYREMLERQLKEAQEKLEQLEKEGQDCETQLAAKA